LSARRPSAGNRGGLRPDWPSREGTRAP